MRTVHLVPDMGFGGLQEIVKGLVLGLRDHGQGAAVACWSGLGNHPGSVEELRQAGVEVGMVRDPGDGPLSSFRRLVSYLQKGDFGVLHVHNPLSYYPYAVTAARAARVPLVINTVHATAMFDRMGPRSKGLFWASALQSDRIVSVSAGSQEALRRRFLLPSRKLAVVDNGIPLSRFLAVTKRPLRDQIVFGAVGRMTTVKNHKLLIAAFAEVFGKFSHARLRILGGGPLENALRKQVEELHLRDAVEFCGFSSDVPAFLAGLDVFVLSSNNESFSLVAVEASASGLPVISTEVGVVPALVRGSNGGWLCPPGDLRAMAAAMEAAIQSPDRRERGEQARQFVAAKYSAERMVSDYEALYQSLQC